MVGDVYKFNDAFPVLLKKLSEALEIGIKLCYTTGRLRYIAAGFRQSFY